jgi:serine/threonine protein phosphatase PrpC
MPYKVSAYGLSDIGLIRQNNEDFWAQMPDEHFFVLADGMGGHQAGEVAAREAVENLCSIFKHLITSSDQSFETAQKIIYKAIRRVNEIVYQLGYQQQELKGMGTTLCCVLIHPDGLIYGHVGDSRIYRLQGNKLEQLTQDHSLLRELINLGQLDENRANEFLYKNIITRAIGTEPIVEPTIQTTSFSVGDIILMCTDGLTDLLSHDEIQKIILSSEEQDIAKKLIKAAKQRGGHDNITVVVVKVQGKNGQTDLS